MIHVDSATNHPKYRQIIAAVERALESGTLAIGEQLPSISELAASQQIARVTVAKAYEELRQRGVILAQHGKGFYVASTQVHRALNVFVLFDTLDTRKETLYKAFMQSLPDDTRLSLFFHQYDRQRFDNLIRDNAGRYNYYVVMPPFDTDVTDTIRLIPGDKLLLLDQAVPTLATDAAVIYIPFEQDTYKALVAGLDRIRLYHRLTLVLPDDARQYVPAGIITGFKRFGREHGVPCVVAETYSDPLVRPGEAYLLFDDQDLIRFIKQTDRQHWQTGHDIGLISFGDAPMKEILKGGITVISTDFTAMGQTAGRLISERSREKVVNLGGLVLRHSL